MIPAKGSLLHLYRIDTLKHNKEVYHVSYIHEGTIVSLVPLLKKFGYSTSKSKHRITGVVLIDPTLLVGDIGELLYGDVAAFGIFIQR